MAATRKTKSGRMLKFPTKYDEFMEDISPPSSPPKKRGRRKQLWSVERILRRRGDEVLVHWTGYSDDFDSWVSLDENPELASFITSNSGNPCSSAVANVDLPPLEPEEREFWLVKHAVFDELKFRRTPEQDTGLDRRVQVKVPFSKEAFSSYFEKGTFPLAKERELDFSGDRNIKFSCTAAEISSVFGADILSRQFGDSSTVCEVDPSSKLYVHWGFELRENFDHSSCPRCTYALECEDDRPALCAPMKSTLPPISYLEISFKKRRRNLIHSRGLVSEIIYIIIIYKLVNRQKIKD